MSVGTRYRPGSTECSNRSLAEGLAISRAGPIGTFVADRLGRLQRFDPVFAALLNLWLRPLDGRRLSVNRLLRRAIAAQIAPNAEHTFVVADCVLPGGQTLLLRARSSGATLRGWIEDVTVLRRSESQLRFAARHDPLTGMLNRRALQHGLADAIARSGERPSTLVFIDLDGFKQINDVFGHAAGDSVLRQFSTRLATCLEANQFAARIGGDEFVVVLIGRTSDQTGAWVQALHQLVRARPFTHFEHEFALSFSAGSVRLVPSDSPADALAAAANDCTRLKSPDARDRRPAGTRPDPRSRLQSASVTADEARLRIQVQPVFAIGEAQRAVGFEWLLRLRDQTGRLRLPAEFLPTIHRQGLSSRFDLWMIAQVIQWLREQRRGRFANHFCVVKLCAASLHDQRFHREALALLRGCPSVTERIRIELHGRHAWHGPISIRRFIDAARELDTRTVVSGFGDAPVWMPRLADLQPIELKLDADWFGTREPDRAARLAVRTLIDSCRALGIETCASRIEHAKELERARNAGFDLAQGFLLGKPERLEQLGAGPTRSRIRAEAGQAGER